MKREIILILIILFISSITFSSASPHCWRQDISRVNSSYTSDFGFDTTSGSYTTSTLYDYVVQPGTEYRFNGLKSHTWECDNGADTTQKDFGVIWDRLEGIILKTNSGDGMDGPKSISSDGCIRSNGAFCYIDGSHYYPSSGSCQKGGNLGAGDETNIEYIFTATDIGEHTLTAEIGAVSPATSDPYSSKIMYRKIPGSKQKIYVGSPSLLIFGPEQKILTGTYNETGEIRMTLLYTVMNRSFFDNRIVDYNVICPSNITCEPDNTYKNNWPIKSEEEITIPVTITLQNDEAPLEVAINMELEFSSDDITDCDPNTLGNNCNTNAEPTKITLGLLDHQDFQVKSIDTFSSDYCIGPDGIVGLTGEEYAPKVNLEFGNGSDPLISIDECDETDITKNANPDGVYCSQLEFLVELGKKIDAISKLREDIQEYESLGQYSKATALRQEENKYTSFSSYLRAQDISDVLSTIDTFDTGFAQDTGLEIWTTSAIEQKKYLEELYNSINGVEFIIKENGKVLEETDLDPGIYKIRIDMNELGEVTTSNYLFTNKILNPTISIKVTIEKERSPRLNWFFYEEGYEDDFEELFRQVGSTSTGNAFSTNVLNRGEIIKFDESNGTLGNASFYNTYAYPTFVVVAGDIAGDANTQIKLNNITEEPTKSFVGKETLTYWTGFASSRGGGCETTAQNTQKNFLPYRVPDLATANDLFYLNDLTHNLSKVYPSSKLLLSTVFYLPYESSSTQTLDLETQMPLYHANNLNSAPSYTLSLDESMSSYKVADLNAVFNGINNNNICVYRELGARQENKWTIFWNEQELLKDLNAMTHTITNINVC